MNTVSVSKAIEKATGLRKSEKQKDYVRDSGSGNIAYRLRKVDRWRNGDFHISKYYQNSYDLYLDNTDAAKKGDDVVKVLEDLGCTNIIPHIDRKWIRFDIPAEEKIVNGYERNADTLERLFSRVEGDTWTDKSGKTWMYKEGVPDEKLDYDVNENVPDREKYHAYKMFVTKYNPENKRTWNEKGKLYPLYINAKNYYEIGPWYKCGYGASKVLVDEFAHEPLYDKNGKLKVQTYDKGLAFRPGGHAGGLPLMRHRGRKDLPHNGDNDFDYFHSQEVFAEIEFSGHYDYTDLSKKKQAESSNPNDPYEAGFTDINDLNTNGMGYYRFKTNTNASDDEAWFIASAFRIVRVISDNEMRKIIGDYNTEHGTDFKPQMRGAPNGKDGDKFNADFTQFGLENSFRGMLKK